MTESTAAPHVETFEFQAEVKKLLDIVIHSLYTEREIFLRELISNAADALEKYRHQSLLEKETFDSHLSLEINIEADPEKKTITVTDTGIGMDRGELEANLGTIAHSGSKTFFSRLAETDRKDLHLIGQFGVGFYAAFMVADKVRVQSRSYRAEDQGHEWASDGAGTFTISPCPGIRRGTRVILELKPEAQEFADEWTIKKIVKQYSNFVSFPIKVKGEPVNTVQAVWAKPKNEIKEEEYAEFYKFIANAVEEPLYRLHFSTDAPLSIQALLFVPKDNFERLGFGRLEPGVNLYCQKVLIEQHSGTILPEWLRFVKGVVDSEDLPLNISRQALQDNALVAKINKVLTKRFLRFLEEMAKEDAARYGTFYQQFGMYLKEGAVADFAHRSEIAKLLRFETSKTAPGGTASLSDYLGRMPEGQKDIYYINGASREAIEAGPYVEAFRRRDLEIIYTLEPIDDFVFSHLGEFEGKKLLSADRGDLELPEFQPAASGENQTEAPPALDREAAVSLTRWMKEVLGARVKEVQESKRLVDSPAIVVNPDGFLTSSMERVMRASGQGLQEFGTKILEINSSHPLIRNLASLREKDESFARTIAEQILDNALIQAGLVVDSRSLVERTYRILERVTEGKDSCSQ